MPRARILTKIKPYLNFLNVNMKERHQVLTRCPVCGDELRIVRLDCQACGSALEGSFTLGRFQRLTREQWQFVELFMLCRGKIKDVEERLGVSYPTVVARLNEVVRAKGYEVDQRESEAL